MRVLSVIGPSETGKTTLIEQLLDHLDGAVATVKHCTHPPTIDTEGTDTARHRAAGAAATYGISDEQPWFATGEQRSLTDLLDALAPQYAYTLVEGFRDVPLPHVALGGATGAGKQLAAGADYTEIDPAAVRTALAETEPYVTLASLVSQVTTTADADRAGAIATFTGRVRRRDGPDDPPTEYLEFEKYEGIADDRLAELCSTLQDRSGVYNVCAHHRTGRIAAGEPIVYVVVLAGHRQEAFAAVEAGIDRLKEEVPIFKKEVTVEDEYWRHEQ